MLVLTRRPGEEIIINGNIRVTVVSIKGDRIRIGIEAPPDVHIWRGELPVQLDHAAMRAALETGTKRGDDLHADAQAGAGAQQHVVERRVVA